MSEKDKKDEGPGADTAFYVLLIPVFLTALASLVTAWWAARLGASYRAVKIITIPAIVIMTNMVCALIAVPLVFALAAITGDRSFSLNTVCDISLFTLISPLLAKVWGHDIQWDKWVLSDTTSWLTIIIYQIIIWLALGSRLLRHIAISLFDSAVVRIAISRDESPLSVRQHIARTDEIYVKDALHYENNGSVPLLGVLLVALSGGSPGKYYWLEHS